jgi:hypothetical protein
MVSVKKSAPSLKELWVKGDIVTRVVLAACAAFALFLFFAFRLYTLFENGWVLLWLFSVWFAYLMGVTTEKGRWDRLAIERQERIEATRAPEERAAMERNRVRDQVIHGLTSEERAMFAVSVPNDPKQIALEERVEKEVERILKNGK